MGTSNPDSNANRQLKSEQESVLENSSANIEMSSWTWKRIHLPGRFVKLLTMFMLRMLTVCSTSALIVLLLFWFYGGISLLVLLHLAVLGVLYNAQDMLLYYPDQPASSRIFVDSPGSFGLVYETVYIRSYDGTQIHAQFVRQSATVNAAAPTIVLFHGNAGNIGHRLPNAQTLCLHNHVNVLLVEYRGYGKSRGSPSEHGIYQDARAAIDYLFTRSDVNQQKIMVFGRSLGGAVALNIASDPYYSSRIAAVLVENTFTSIPEMARALFDISVLHYLPEWCYKNKYLSRCLVHKVTIPALFLCGLQDNLVPPRMMQQLYELCGSHMKRLASFVDGTHNDTWQCHGYYEAVNRFLTEVDESHKGIFVSASTSYSEADDFSYRDNANGSLFI